MKTNLKTLCALFLAAFAIASTAPAARLSAPLPATVNRAMNEPTSVTVFSLHPGSTVAPWYRQRFHGFRILGQVTVEGTEQKVVTASLKKILNDWNGAVPPCILEPRHGVRITRGGRTIDFLICFQCQKMFIFSGGPSHLDRSFTGSADALNAVLRAAHVKLAKTAP